jgi:UDP-N-acetylglucosamine:LPS N-acetylglucosamine transferase
MDHNGKISMCLAASAGGHLSQLLRLSAGWAGHKTFYITTTDVVSDRLSRSGAVYVVGESNRRYPLRLLKVLLRCVRIIVRERPDVVISTGASVGCIACYIGKLLGARIIWVDSITNVERISFSGRMVRHIADLFLVQWPELQERYPNMEYVGAIV